MLGCRHCGGNVIPHVVPGGGSELRCLQCGREPGPAPIPPLTPPDPTQRSQYDRTYRRTIKLRARNGGACSRCGLRPPRKGKRQCGYCISVQAERRQRKANEEKGKDAEIA